MELKNVKDFDELILKDKVLVDFYAEWCGPCKMITPIMDEIADESTDITVIKVNVDDHQELANKYGIRGIPTIMAMSKGEVLGLIVGVKPKSEILDLLDKK